MLVGKGRLLVPKDAHRVESDRWMMLPAGTEFGIYLIGDRAEYEFELNEGEFEIVGELRIPGM